MRIRRVVRAIAVIELAVLACWGGARVANAAGPLVGEPAPPLDVAQWLAGPPVERFEHGRVYVIDVWAPWCGPCIGGMEHLSELQEREAAHGLVVIGLTGDDDYGATLAGAEAVVKREGPRIRYAIAWDHERASYQRWMARESNSGWPWCFVVDREGRLAWTGHPAGLDPVLSRVLAGTWNLDSAATAYRHRANGLDLVAAFYADYRAARNEAALERYQTLLAFDPAMAAGYAPHEFKVLLLRLQRPAEAYAFARMALDSLLAHDPPSLVRIATIIVDSTKTAPMRDLDVALAYATRAEQASTGLDAGVLETLARVHAARGEWSTAVVTQTRAIAAADSTDRAARQATLTRFKAHRM